MSFQLDFIYQRRREEGIEESINNLKQAFNKLYLSQPIDLSISYNKTQILVILTIPQWEDCYNLLIKDIEIILFTIIRNLNDHINYFATNNLNKIPKWLQGIIGNGILH